MEKHKPKTQQRRETAPLLQRLTEKVKMETGNKRGSTGESSVPSDLHLDTHTHTHTHTHTPLQGIKTALSHLVSASYMRIIL